jgi:hypothetical protein
MKLKWSLTRLSQNLFAHRASWNIDRAEVSPEDGDSVSSKRWCLLPASLHGVSAWTDFVALLHVTNF